MKTLKECIKDGRKNADIVETAKSMLQALGRESAERRLETIDAIVSLAWLTTRFLNKVVKNCPIEGEPIEFLEAVYKEFLEESRYLLEDQRE